MGPSLSSIILNLVAWAEGVQVMGKHIFWQMKHTGTVQWERTDGLSPPTLLIWCLISCWLVIQRYTRHRLAFCKANKDLTKSDLISLDVMHPIHHIHQVILYYNKKLHNCEFEISKLQTKNYSQTVETTWTNKSWLIMMLVRLEVWAGQNLQSDKQNELELAHAGSNLITPIAHLAPSGVAPQVEPQGWDLQTHGYVTLYDLTHL